MCFWKDVWGGKEASYNAFLNLFALATNIDALVAKVWDSTREARVVPKLHKDTSLTRK